MDVQTAERERSESSGTSVHSDTVSRCHIPVWNGGRLLYECLIVSVVLPGTLQARTTTVSGWGFRAFSSSDGMCNKFYVDNHGPGANITRYGSCMYLPGTAGTLCASGSTGNDDGLSLCP